MTTPARFAQQFDFALDDFQLRAIDAVHLGMSTLVAAPTDRETAYQSVRMRFPD